MITPKTIAESLKRHWIGIALVSIACVLAGSFLLPLLKSGGGDAEELVYTAEATLYVNGYDSAEVEDFNYQFSDDKLISDSRRIVISNEVVSKVREKYGDDVVISSPFWKDSESEDTLYTRFIFVDAAASSPEKAVEAADFAAALSLEEIKKYIPVTTAVQSGHAALKPVVSGDDSGSLDSAAADFGANTENGQELAKKKGGISIKQLAISLILGFLGACCVFCGYDLLSRRMRSASDVERMLDVPVIGVIAKEEDCEYVSDALSVLKERFDCATVFFAGFSASDLSMKSEVFSKMGSACEIDLSSDSRVVSCMRKADALVLVVSEGKSNSKQIESGVSKLKLADIPVLGAIFIPNE